jgi:hypothetical protein
VHASEGAAKQFRSPHHAATKPNDRKHKIMADEDDEPTPLGETIDSHAKHAIIFHMIEHMYAEDDERDWIAISSDPVGPEKITDECLAAGWPSQVQMTAIGAFPDDVAKGWVDLFDKIRASAGLKRIPYPIEDDSLPGWNLGS